MSGARDGAARRSGQRGQMMIAMVGVAALVMAAVAAVALVGAARVATVRAQRMADVAAVSAARAMGRGTATRDGLRALVTPLVAPDGGRVESLVLPTTPAGRPAGSVQITVSVPAPWGQRATAVAHAGLDIALGGDGRTGWATGGGYSGPLVYRDGKPMCPAVAAAFDLMDAAARADGVDLRVNSAFRSDAEQAVLFARHPDPKWVAPPGRSRHRESTELDLGGPGYAGWLARNAGRFGFVQRYSWEDWHYGYLPGCGAAPTPAPPTVRVRDELWGDAASTGPPVARAPGTGLPAWVPDHYAALVTSAATTHGLPPILLAALLQAESGFNPRAVSPVGAQGIAQFMPATARGVGLANPFDPAEAIPAAARLLAGHLRTFGSVPLALAAYNAGPGAVQRYGGVPPYRETQAYVARITALAAGAAAPASGAWALQVSLREPVSPASPAA